MENEAYELARAQMIGAINASRGPEQKLYQQNLAILENVGQAWQALEVMSKQLEKETEIRDRMWELCQLQSREIEKLKTRINALEQRPVKKGLFG